MKARDFFGSDANITVRDPEACKSWYQNVFEARQLSVNDLGFDSEEQEGCVFLGWNKNDPVLCLVPRDPSDATVAVITCEDLDAAADYLGRKGVTVSPIQQDRAGMKFFEIRDCEGNTIEFCEEN